MKTAGTNFEFVDLHAIFKIITIHKSKYLLLPKTVYGKILANKKPNEVVGNIKEDDAHIYIILKKEQGVI
ncbi:MAG: hypothetical protein QXH07_07140 [Thermoplasmata archaeon]